jgi:trans-2,3-dihydro-3-hydroxyanthranilate isomerase
MTVRSYDFVQVDVFTDRRFGGNPLAVFLDGAGLSDQEMQSIAREMNLSETTFVLPPTRQDCAALVRIFTPGNELPFAGHPTIGTAWVLATQGRLATDASTTALEETVGRVPISFEGDASRPAFVWMDHTDPVFGEPLAERADIADALGLTEADLLDEHPIQTGSTGVAFLYVPLRDASTVDRVVLDPRALADVNLVGVFVFAPDGPSRVYSRMFAPGASGIPEDPATGGASGALGAYVVERGIASLDTNGVIVSRQGEKMGRPSDIYIRLRLLDGRATDIQVGGSVVPVLEGVLTLD